MVTRYGLLGRPEELVGQLAICEATTKVTIRQAVTIPTWRLSE